MIFKNKYQWKLGDDGTYTIFNLPIFCFYNDKNRGKVDLSVGTTIINNFMRDKRDLGYYPRAFVGHHNIVDKAKATDNKVGAGFLDNINIKDTVFYADITLIPEKIFMDIMEENRYPYRSVEYNPEEKKILGMALLESQAPYFKFPILKLEETQVFKASDKVILFQKQFEDDKEEEKKDKQTEFKDDENTKSNLTPPINNNDVGSLGQGGLGQKLDMLIDLLGKLIPTLGPQPNIDPPEASSVSYQNTLMNHIDKRFDEIKDNMLSEKIKNIYYAKLQAVCNNKGLVFSDHEYILNDMNDAGKDKYITNLTATKGTAFKEPHFASDIARDGIKLFDSNTNKEQAIYAKYTNQEDKINAKKAFELFQTTMLSGNDDNIKLLKISFQTIDNFVDACVTGCKNDPDFISNFK